jgi:hypothetical protein
MLICLLLLVKRNLKVDLVKKAKNFKLILLILKIKVRIRPVKVKGMKILKPKVMTEEIKILQPLAVKKKKKLKLVQFSKKWLNKK